MYNEWCELSWNVRPNSLLMSWTDTQNITVVHINKFVHNYIFIHFGQDVRREIGLWFAKYFESLLNNGIIKYRIS